MEFRILGPVQLWHEGRQLPLGRAKERAALGVLLLNHGRPLPTEMIMDALWDDDRPANVHKDLQTYISRLRKTLRSADCGTEIVSRHQSYAVRTKCVIDYHRSMDLLAAGRRAKQLGQLETASVALYEAVHLWQGQVIEDLRTDWIELRREELDNKRVACQQALIDVELLRGNNLDALDLINQAISGHEFDISLISLRLRALHGCGYYTEFDSYWQQARRLLVRAFGTEPDRALQELHIRLLQDRDGIGTHAPPEGLSLPPLPVPAQLPPPSAHFTGRDTEMEDLQMILDRTRSAHPLAMPVLAVVGSAGAGKSAVAVEWCHTMRQSFPDGQLFADLAGYSATGPVDPAQVLADFLIALGIRAEQVPASLEQRSALFRSMVDGRHILVLLDNARSTAQVLPLLPGSAACLVVVTSRHRLTDLVTRHGARRLRIGPLPTSAIASLLQHGASIDNLGVQDAAITELAQHSAGLPAVVLGLGEHLAEHPHLTLGALLTELKQTPAKVLSLGRGETGDRSIATTLTWTYNTLPSETARLFRLLTVHPGHHYTCTDAAALNDSPTVDAAQRQLDDLYGVHFLEQALPDRYTFAPVVATYAATRAATFDTAEAQSAAQRRLLDYYADTSARAARALRPGFHCLPPVEQNTRLRTRFTTVREALRWLDAELDNLVAAIHLADDLGLPHAWRIPGALTEYLLLTEHTDEFALTHTIALQAAEDAANNRATVAALRGLAITHRLRGQLDHAEQHVQQWLALSSHEQADPWRCEALLELAKLHRARDSHDQAILLCQEVLAISQAHADRDLQASSLHGIASIEAFRGNLLDAITQFDHALHLRLGLRQPATAAATHRRLAEAHHRLGDIKQAAQHAHAAITLYDEHVACRRDVVPALVLLADIDAEDGHHLTSMTHSHRALALCHPTADRVNAARALELVGRGLQALGKWQDANDEWQQALELLTGINDPFAEQVRSQIAKHSPAQQP